MLLQPCSAISSAAVRTVSSVRPTSGRSRAMISRIGLVGMASISLMLLDLVGGAVVQPRWTAPTSRDCLLPAI
jgi:hypothetical protein